MMDPPGGEGGGDGVKNIGFLVNFAAQEAYLLKCSKYKLFSGTKLNK